MSLRAKVAEAIAGEVVPERVKVQRALCAVAEWLRSDEGRERVSSIVRAGTVTHVSDAAALVLDEEADRG